VRVGRLRSQFCSSRSIDFSRVASALYAVRLLYACGLRMRVCVLFCSGLSAVEVPWFMTPFPRTFQTRRGQPFLFLLESIPMACCLTDNASKDVPNPGRGQRVLVVLVTCGRVVAQELPR
jgi:hypothetical protein